MGLSDLSTGKTILLLEGIMDKEILRIFYPKIESTYTLNHLMGKGKISNFVDSFDRVINELISRGINIYAILDRDRDMERLIQNKNNETKKRISILPLTCIENYLINNEAIFQVLTRLIGKEKLIEKEIYSSGDIGKVIDRIIESSDFREKELKLHHSLNKLN